MAGGRYFPSSKSTQFNPRSVARRGGRHGARPNNRAYSSRTSPPREDIPAYYPLESTLGEHAVSNPLSFPYAVSPPCRAGVAMGEVKGKGPAASSVPSENKELEEGELEKTPIPPSSRTIPSEVDLRAKLNAKRGVSPS